MSFALFWTCKSDLNVFPSWSEDPESKQTKKKPHRGQNRKSRVTCQCFIIKPFFKLWYTQKTSFLKNAWYVGRRSVGWQLCSPTLKITISNNQDTTKNCTRRQQPGFVYTCKTSPMIYPITSICLTFFSISFCHTKALQMGGGAKAPPVLEESPTLSSFV